MFTVVNIYGSKYDGYISMLTQVSGGNRQIKIQSIYTNETTNVAHSETAGFQVYWR